MKWRLRITYTLTAVIALAAAGTLAGREVQGAAGAALGAVLGALAGIATGYVPGIREKARQRAAAKTAAATRLRTVMEPEFDSELKLGPSLFLRPEEAVVGFTGRDVELDQLRAWAESESPRSVRALVGEGGVGKTRLALQLADQGQHSERRWLMVAAGQEADALTVLRGVVPSGPVLLIVDYAETRTRLGDLLREVLDDAGPVRVLLLARSLGEWWDRLAEMSAPAIAALLAAQEPMRLDAPIASEIPDADLAAAAVPFFAARLGAPAPESIAFDLPVHRVPVLVLHAAALVGVLRSLASRRAPLTVEVHQEVLGELLAHEARYWRRTAEAAGLPGDGPVLKAVITAAILLGAADLPDAGRAVGRVPDLVGETEGRLRRWGRWLYGLYPAGPDGRLGSVQPDLLAEHHAVSQLTADRSLIPALLRDLSDRQAEQALTVLARAWELHEGAGRVIEAALRADLVGLAGPASEVAIRTRSDMGGVLARALADTPATIPDLIRIAEALPYPSVALAGADVVVTQRIRRVLPAETEPQVVADWADRASTRLAQVGNPADALAPAQEAVLSYRKLDGLYPERYRPALARSLSSLGTRYSELGRPADALPPAQEAVAIFRQLAAVMPDQYLPDLAQSLHNLGIRCSELGRPAEALPLTQEAVKIRRELAAKLPDRYLSDLAQSLHNLGVRSWELGRPADALPPAREAVAIFRQLAAALPDRYRSSLGQSLSNLGLYLRELGRIADAISPTQEAVTLLRLLAAAAPGRYRHALAQALNNLSAYLSELHRPAEALPPIQEAVVIRRELAATLPDRYLPHLAQSLQNLGQFLSELEQSAAALPPAREAVTIYRGLSAALPDQYLPDLANALSSLSKISLELGLDDEALPLAEEAVVIYRGRAGAGIRDRHRLAFAESLENLGNVLSALGRHEEAASARYEAAHLRETSA